MRSTADNGSTCGVPTVELNMADNAASTLTVVFVSDNRRRLFRGTNAFFLLPSTNQPSL